MRLRKSTPWRWQQLAAEALVECLGGFGRGEAEHDQLPAVALQEIRPRRSGQLLGESVDRHAVHGAAERLGRHRHMVRPPALDPADVSFALAGQRTGPGLSDSVHAPAQKEI